MLAFSSTWAASTAADPAAAVGHSLEINEQLLNSDNSHCLCFLSPGKNISICVCVSQDSSFSIKPNGNHDCRNQCDHSGRILEGTCVFAVRWRGSLRGCWWILAVFIGSSCVPLPVRVPDRQEIRAPCYRKLQRDNTNTHTQTHTHTNWANIARYFGCVCLCKMFFLTESCKGVSETKYTLS